MSAKPKARPEMVQTSPEISIWASEAPSRIVENSGSARPWSEDKAAYCIFLDQIDVVCGASRKQIMHNVQDLIVGDMFRLPSIKPQNRSSITYQDDQANITLETSIEVGPADMFGARVGSVVLMSGNAHTLGADLIQIAESRIVLALVAVHVPRKPIP